MIAAIQAEIGKVVIGQREMIELMLLTLLSRGHILLEGVPGLAKSLAVETFARVIGGSFRRFQFTPDRMPGDITGTTIYHQKSGRFSFRPGPVFCNIFLADEINRASPKVQSALLEAMQERRVDVDGERHAVPSPFIVLATQNPIEQTGTYPLAEAQVDRFMVRYDVRYLNRNEEAELAVRKDGDFEQRLASVRQITTPAEILRLQTRIHDAVRISGTVRNYILNLCVATRPPETYPENPLRSDLLSYVRLGASPRSVESLLSLSKSRAFFQGRTDVRFEDVNDCAPHVLRHRILLKSGALAEGITADRIVAELLQSTVAY